MGDGGWKADLTQIRLPVLGWRVRYADGTAYSSVHAPEEIRPDGVCNIVQFLDPPYREFLDGCDWYVWEGSEGRWWGVPSKDWDNWEPRPEDRPGRVILRGCGRLPADVYERLTRAMRDDHSWP